MEINLAANASPPHPRSIAISSMLCLQCSINLHINQPNSLYLTSEFRHRTNISNSLDLNRHTLGQLLDSDAAARGLVRKVLLSHVVEENVDLRRTLRKRGSLRGVGYKGHRTLTTREMSVPASFRMAVIFSQHALVLSAMLPSIRLPLVSAGIWPETKMLGPAMMACDCPYSCQLGVKP
jgi:hypothetical protein